MGTPYEAVIGLEVHAQLQTQTKLFCGCSTAYGAEPNTQVCPVCLGLPGALPVPNARVLELAARTGLALGCDVRLESRFARKNYFYPDLAKGYQISQFALPLNEGGEVRYRLGDEERVAALTRIHIEEDAAKNLHGHGGATLVDFNRAGVPLIEIVGEPVLRSAEEAEAYLRALHEVLMFIGVNDGNLEEGSFRCDANVSLRPVGQTELGTRTELKNINSFRFVRMGIEVEIARQTKVLDGGGTITQETRGFHETTGKSVPMRSKEEAHDYRYFPDPDLGSLSLESSQVAAIGEAMPRLPAARRADYVASYGLTLEGATVLTGHPAIADYFEEAAAALTAGWGEARRADAGKRAANFVAAEVLRYTETRGLEASFPVTAAATAELLMLVDAGTISGKQAKDVFAAMRETGDGAQTIVDARGMAQVSDVGALEAEVQKVLEGSPDQVAAFRAGKTKMRGYFVGQVMKATRGAANPKLVNEILDRLLS